MQFWRTYILVENIQNKLCTYRGRLIQQHDAKPLGPNVRCKTEIGRVELCLNRSNLAPEWSPFPQWFASLYVQKKGESDLDEPSDLLI